MNKRKIINDPVYGFITIPTDLIFDLLEHQWFQRLSRIRQLGLTYLVYPGAQHSRLQHALGAMHLIQQALEVLKSKGAEIAMEEAEAVTVAIMLHDLGHSPFSHTLERMLITGISHEALTIIMMDRLNEQFNGMLTLAIEIFRGSYHKKFLHQLVSSQLDVDRLDYLNRDSFFTGVAEGVIGYDRIIKMLIVKDNELMVEEKGIYSIEKFLVSRRLMYWQVYLHKTVLVAEEMLINIIRRARIIFKSRNLQCPSTLSWFLQNQIGHEQLISDPSIIDRFADIDDPDIISAVKLWRQDEDFVLSHLSRQLLSRKLMKIELQSQQFPDINIEAKKMAVRNFFGISPEESGFLVISDSTSNHAYNPYLGPINILFKNGAVKDIADASDLLNVRVLEDPVVKYYLCYPKEISE